MFGGLTLADFLSERWVRLLKHSKRRLIGLLLIALAFIIGLALGSWSVADPSFNHDTTSAPQNLLGLPGASFADMTIQFFGLAAFLFVVLPLYWGARMAAGYQVPGKKWRLPMWLIALLVLSTAIAGLPSPEGWPLNTGLGGYIGDIFYNITLGLTRPILGAITGIAITVITGLIGLFCLKLAAGISLRKGEIERDEDDFEEEEEIYRPQDEDFDEDEPHFDDTPHRKKVRARAVVKKPRDEDEDDGFHPLGFITHHILATRAFVRRNLKGRKIEPRMHAPVVDEYGRVEPGLGEGRDDFDDAVEPRWHDDDGYDREETGDWDEVFDEAHISQNENIVAFPGGKRAAVGEHRQSLEGASKKIIRKQARSSGRFTLPPLNLLEEPRRNPKARVDEASLQENASALETVLQDFGVRGEITQVRPGPVVTLYELEPAPGTKSSRVIGLADDIARSMSAISARVAVVPGRNAIGIELPNEARETVFLRELLASKAFVESRAKLPLCLGKTIGGEPVIADLARMPHLLIAGTTGSGKSVAINTMILSLLYRLNPEECRVIMVDPKMLELSIYDGIPHLLAPVVTDPKKAVVALKWAVREMEERYKKMSKLGVRNIDGFNQRVKDAAKKGETVTRTVQTGFDPRTGEAIYETEALELEAMPYLVVIVDEMADLMMVAGKDIEGAIQRLAQMARAAGIHLIMATQRPSVDVITGTIKANFPTRISFQVTSKIDSRTILGEQGAEQLLGQGDMLYMMGGGRIARVHGPFVSDEDVEDVVGHLKAQGVPDYLDAVTDDFGMDDDGAGDYGSGDYGGSGDELYDQAVAIVLRDRKASTSYIQRRLSVGYNKAASLIERMEREGLISQANHAGKREILVGGDDD